MTLFRRFFLLLFAWTFVAIGGVGLLAWRMTVAAKESAMSYHRQLLDFTTRYLDQYARELNGRLAFVADLEPLPPGSPLVFKTMQAAVATYPELVYLSLKAPDGRELFKVADDRLLAAGVPKVWDALDRRAQASGRLTRGDVAVSGTSPLMPLAYPLKGGRFLEIGISLEDLWRSVRAERVGPSGRIVLADGSGRLMPLFGAAALPAVLHSGEAREGWLEIADRGRWVSAFRRFEPLDWTVATLQPRGEAYLEADRFAMQTIVFFGLLLVLAGLSAARISAQLSAPLIDLVAGARRIAGKDFGTPVPLSGWAELQALSRTFNGMMEELRRFNELQIERILDEKSKVDALVQTIPEGILMADLDGRLLYVNKTLPTLLGSDPKSAAAARTFADILTDRSILEMAESLRRKEQRWITGDAAVESEGFTRHLKILGTVVAKERRDVGLLLLFRDVTPEIELQRMKDDFFQSVVHDLRSPLTTIQGFVELMRMRQLSPQEGKFIDYVRFACENLGRLISDILDISKLEAGKYELQRQPADPKDIVGKAFRLFVLAMETKGIRYALTLDDALMPVRADAEKLQRVVTNLIGNAMKFTPGGGRVDVEARPIGGDKILVSVTDTGPGIPADQLTAVFEKFHQTEVGRKQRSGYGLGLTICKHIVELHGGRIWVESTVGKGSRFQFELPITAASPAEPTAKTA